MNTQVRVARPVGDLARAVAMYERGLALHAIGSFRDHGGFDGVMLGVPGTGLHFEFTYCRSHPVRPAPTPEDLLVFYVPDRAEWGGRCEAMLGAGFAEVEPFNPYWRRHGRTFQDPDGYRVVIQRASWGGPTPGSSLPRDTIGR